MPYSHIEQLWPNGSIKSLGSLKRFDLSNSKRLTKSPDLAVAPKLESLNLEDCPSLSEIHPSIFHHDRLKLLKLCACTSLQSLPDDIDLKSIERLYLSDCSRLEKLPDAMGNMTTLRLLYLNGTSIKELPFSIERLSCLSVLSLKDCKKLSALPSVFGGLLGLSSLKLVELPCSRFRDMDNAEVTRFWRYFSSRTTIKFSNGISMPMLHNLGDVSPEDFNYPKIEAVYIGFDGRPYGIHNWRAEADDLLCKVIYGSSVEPRIPHWFNNRSCSSSITLDMHPNLDDRRKVKGYALFVVYETNFFQSSFIDFDFETNEGPLSTRPLALRVDVESKLGSIWVYIPAKWFLVRAKNVDGWSYLKVSVSAIFKVKECGVRLVHEHDAQEFYDSITCMYPLGSLDSEFLQHLYSYLEMDCYSVQPLH
ncbi:Protein SUPPRESSOR OF npr1-1, CONSTITUTIVE 1 [Morella rubra]|uniref:Protein SUPPRESSOR OF npr1-1, CONSTITUTIVE 1 n=1 Tax=Morella rubra TaxID=262757 RepID=A0A6A1VFT6_9ROSI|nr:Protein SUPPRESSOR OF npr1-1, CONSTITUTIVE 1 [Morella rubra]